MRIRIDKAQSRVKCARFRIICVFIFALGVVNLGCNKDDVKSDEYYVKYEVNSSTIYMGGKLEVELTNENNLNTKIQIPTRAPWETIIGPVKKGFKASLKVSEAGKNYGHLKLYTQISVSKNGDPFVLKSIDGSDVPRDSVYLNYIIE